MRDPGHGRTVDSALLIDLSGRADPVGYLTIYVDVDPRLQATRRPPWEIAVDHELRSLEARARVQGTREHLAALVSCLERIGPEVRRLLDSSEPGRGRALFAPISTPEATEAISLQLPLPTCVVLDTSPYVRPLVTALERGRPAGVVVVSQAGIRVIEVAFGDARDRLFLELAEDTDDWREMKGPAAGNPQLAQQTAPQHDRFDRRLADVRTRAIATRSAEITAFAAERSWEQIAILGDPRLTAAVAAALTGHGREVVTVHRTVGGDPTEVSAAVQDELAAARLRCERALADRIVTAAGSRQGGAVVGLGDTLEALNEGRVAHLFLDANTLFEGNVTPDGHLFPEGVVPPGFSEPELSQEPRLVERMIERALATGARVTPVEDAAALLGTSESVAALLRW
jgi:hypothetical protein